MKSPVRREAAKDGVFHAKDAQTWQARAPRYYLLRIEKFVR
jgi:hypothetical protein